MGVEAVGSWELVLLAAPGFACPEGWKCCLLVASVELNEWGSGSASGSVGAPKFIGSSGGEIAL